MGRLFGTDGVRGLANAELTPELGWPWPVRLPGYLRRAIVRTARWPWSRSGVSSALARPPNAVCTEQPAHVGVSACCTEGALRAFFKPYFLRSWPGRHG